MTFKLYLKPYLYNFNLQFQFKYRAINGGGEGGMQNDHSWSQGGAGGLERAQIWSHDNWTAPKGVKSIEDIEVMLGTWLLHAKEM